MKIFQNNFYKYYQFILKFRVAIVAFFALVFLYLLITMTASFTHNDDELWLKGSNEYSKLQNKTHEQVYIQKLQLKVGDKAFSKENINNLQLLHANLEKIQNIQKVKSPLTHNMITSSQDNEGSSLLELTMLYNISITFRSIIPSLLGSMFIAFNSLFTISVYQFFQPDVPMHVSILLVAIAVSIMDFVYIYYGWHIMQRSHGHKRSIY